MKRATMQHARVGAVHLVVHSSENPTDEEWSNYLDDMEAFLPRMRGVMVLTHGGGPTATQRAKFKTFWGSQKIDPEVRLAVLTSSVMVRGIVTAVTWFVKNPIQTFAPTSLDEAFTFLGLTGHERTLLRERVDQLQKSLGR